ncbi:MAG: hypothetical protein AAF560_34260 [Acidobacteriota bacterium]
MSKPESHGVPSANIPSSADITAIEVWLKRLLRFAGTVMLLAFGAVVMPTEWMEASHQRLGLGEFPTTPLVDYLTRSISMLYGIYGGMYLVIARDLRRLAPVLKYMASANIVFGAAMVAIDLHAGMPWYWVAGEGPSILAFAVLLLVMVHRVPQPRS